MYPHQAGQGRGRMQMVGIVQRPLSLVALILVQLAWAPLRLRTESHLVLAATRLRMDRLRFRQ